MTPPVLRVGWQTDQSANSKDLTFNLNPGSFQSNPRLGNTANVFNLPSGSRSHSAAPAVPNTCSDYFSCYAGSSGAAAGTAAIAITTPPSSTQATSKVPCFPSVSGECDVTKASPAPINNALSTLTPAPVASES